MADSCGRSDGSFSIKDGGFLDYLSNCLHSRERLCTVKLMSVLSYNFILVRPCNRCARCFATNCRLVFAKSVLSWGRASVSLQTCQMMTLLESSGWSWRRRNSWIHVYMARTVVEISKVFSYATVVTQSVTIVYRSHASTRERITQL
jgi:hypothetical protein